MWSELAARNRDNVSRTDSYLELYAWTRAHPPELPWLFMAHLVSRNAGYMMTDLARNLAGKAGSDATLAPPMRTLFLLLERGNFLIFWDAWHHTIATLLGEPLTSPRTPRFMIDAWARWRRGESDERRLVLDLVHNEQHLIEHRVVHHEHLRQGRLLLDLIEAGGREKPLVFPHSDSEIKVGGFAQLARRIATGERIFDEVLADRAQRDRMFAWALAHPHTGSREIYGGKPGPTLREAWPVEVVAAMWDGIHADPEPDPSYP